MMKKTGLLTVVAILAMVMLMTTSGCFEEDIGGIYYPVPEKPAPLIESTASVVEHEYPTPKMAPTTEYVLCSDYSKITDRYKTPHGFYIVIGNDTIPVTDAEYDKTKINGYVKYYPPGTIHQLPDGWWVERYGYEIADIADKLIPVTESESGYRMACKAIRS